MKLNLFSNVKVLLLIQVAYLVLMGIRNIYSYMGHQFPWNVSWQMLTVQEYEGSFEIL